MSKKNLINLIQSKRVIVSCGSGGVGKTTTSAAIAIRAAIEGKTAIVITIDPAKRLATSLGLKKLSSTATDLSEIVTAELRSCNQPALKGKIFAVMPDTTQTFEKFIQTMAGGNEKLAGRVLKTSIFKIFAKEFSGTNEYMAMEKLYELYSEKKYDLIVLDTPPSANTRAFLDAPARLAEFFDDKIMKWLVAPGGRLVAIGVKKALEILEKLTGHGFISDLIEFTASLFELRTQFTENLKMVARLLHQDDVSFLMVTSPERLSKKDTQDFVKLLSDDRYPFWGFVVNRVLSARLQVPTDSNVDLSDWLSKQNANAVLKENFSQLIPVLEHEQEAARFLEGLTGGDCAVALVPEQPTDVHSVGALIELSRHF